MSPALPFCFNFRTSHLQLFTIYNSAAMIAEVWVLKMGNREVPIFPKFHRHHWYPFLRNRQCNFPTHSSPPTRITFSGLFRPRKWMIWTRWLALSPDVGRDALFRPCRGSTIYTPTLLVGILRRRSLGFWPKTWTEFRRKWVKNATKVC